MAHRPRSTPPRAAAAPSRLPRLRRRALLAGLLLLATWLAFFDSHSLLKRVQWSREHDRLRAENEALRAEIEDLEGELAKGLSEERVEKIAREQYGMRRPGETVYRVDAR
jgi:cell division protein FtsB